MTHYQKTFLRILTQVLQVTGLVILSELALGAKINSLLLIWLVTKLNLELQIFNVPPNLLKIFFLMASGVHRLLPPPASLPHLPKCHVRREKPGHGTGLQTPQVPLQVPPDGLQGSLPVGQEVCA